MEQPCQRLRSVRHFGATRANLQYFSGSFSQDFEAGEVLVCRGVSELDEPCGEADLGGYGSDGARVRAELQRVDHAVDEADDGAGVALSDEQRRASRVISNLCSEQRENRVQGVREGRRDMPGGQLRKL